MNLLDVFPLAQDSLQNVNTELDVTTSISTFDLALKGGIVMGVLFIMFMIATYVFVERAIVINRAHKEDQSFMERIKDYIHQQKIDVALSLCRQTDAPYARLVEKGITRLGRPMSDVMTIIENAGNIEISKLEKKLSILATIASTAPMIGFLGTVTGMIQAFIAMASAGSNVSVLNLSEGIYQALVTTVGGLVVGIIALFAYNYLITRIKNIVNKLEMQIMNFMDILNEPIV